MEKDEWKDSELLVPGASMVALVLPHGMNASVLHRWLEEHRQGTLLLSDGSRAPASSSIDLAASLPVWGSDGEPSVPPSNITP